MEYTQTDLTPNREVSLFVLKNKNWVDVFNGPVTFVYDIKSSTFECIFKTMKLGGVTPHVYRLQPKIRRKGPKAFVVRAAVVNAEKGTECILAFRFESSTDSLNFQYFMDQPAHVTGPGSSVPPNSVRNLRPRYGSQHGRVGSQTNSLPKRRHSHNFPPTAKRISNSYHKARNLSVKSQLTPSIDGSVRSREIPKVNVLPLTEENLLLHDAINRPRPRKVADVLQIA